MSIVILDESGYLTFASSDIHILDLSTLPSIQESGDFAAEMAADHFAAAVATAADATEAAVIERAAEARGVYADELAEAVALYEALSRR